MAGVNINSSKLSVKVLGYSDAAALRATKRVRLRAIASIIGQGRYGTGQMARGFEIKSVPTTRSRRTYRLTNSAPHFPFQELGTPKSAPGVGFIYPKNKKLLRFRPKGSNAFVFARRVRGVRPGYFLRNAARQTTERDFEK